MLALRFSFILFLTAFPYVSSLMRGSAIHPASSSTFSSAVPPSALTPAPTISALVPVRPLVKTLADLSASESPVLPYAAFASPAPWNISSVATSLPAVASAYSLSSFAVAPSFSAWPLVVPYVLRPIEASAPNCPVPVAAPTAVSTSIPVPDSAAPYRAFSKPVAFFMRLSHSACLASCFF